MSKLLSTLVATAAMGFVALATPTTAHAGDLTVEVKNGGEKGTVMVALYTAKDKWMGRSSFANMTAARGNSVTLTFKDLEPGEYAVTLFVDENGNGKLDMNAVGIPVEPYAFSNDAAGMFGPPSFEKAKFSVGADSKTISINVAK
jgi:uncharacterized protein (DUF2141 family)